ncbi:beta-propeller fold lactonase family protein [Microbacterium sp. NPDC089696]|uniref:beta-propeller fold lactonase family protein n=1 Tax=Microbacterium sp. NPDC089696 TaxID=3364199 RepID=UPI00380AEF21
MPAPTTRIHRRRSTALRLIVASILALGVALSAPTTEASADTPIDLIGGVAVGSTPYGSVLSPDGTRLYVVQTAGTVTAIDTSSRTVVATTTFPGSVFTGAAVSPDGSKVYAIDLASAAPQARVLDAQTLAQVAGVPVGNSPYAATLRPGTSEIWVANYAETANAITVIDTTTDTVAAQIAGRDGGRDIAFSPDGAIAYVSHTAVTDYDIEVIEATTRSALTPLPREFTAERVEGMAVSPDGSTLYGANPGGYSLTAIDAATGAVDFVASVGSTPVDVALTSDGRRAYVADRLSRTISVVDTSTGTRVATIPTVAQPWSLQISPDDRTLYAMLGSNEVAVVALDAFPEVTTLSLPSGTGGIPYSTTIAATGTPAPSFAVTTGALPAGLTLDPATGVLAGTPTVSGAFPFTVTASSTVSGIPSSSSRAYTLTLAAVVSVPSAPRTLSASPGDGGIDLTWAAPTSDGGTPLTGYRVERAVGGVFTVLVADTATTGTSYRDGTAVPGQAYDYRVTALNAAGAGAVSASSAALLPVPAPGGSSGGSTAGGTAVDATPPAEGLATTGGTLPLGALGAGILLVLGGAALLVARRRLA